MPKKMAALLMSTSMRPKRSATARQRRWVSSSLDTSTRSKRCPRSRATAAPFSALMSATTTRAPSLAKRPAEAAERDVPVADDDTLAGTHGAHLEVAHLHDGDASRAPADVLVEAALDPGIVQLEDDAEPGRGEGVGEVEPLVEGVEEAE